MLRIARVGVESFLVKLSERGREGGGEMNKFFDELLRDKKKNCIAKQHYINIGGFATQMEAYRLAKKFVNVWEYLKSIFLLMKDIWKSLNQSAKSIWIKCKKQRVSTCQKKPRELYKLYDEIIWLYSQIH